MIWASCYHLRVDQTHQRGAAARLARASTEGLDTSMAAKMDVRRYRKQASAFQNDDKAGEVRCEVRVQFRVVEL